MNGGERKGEESEREHKKESKGKERESTVQRWSVRTVQ